MTDIFSVSFNGLDLIVLVALGTSALVCSWALSRSAAIGDRQARRAFQAEEVKKQVERTYWERRHGGRMWPGKDS